MGAFQIVYDDFSGGQYMGPRSTNQPKNTWIGENVLVNSKGELIPTGALLAVEYFGPVGSNRAILCDHWVGNMEVRGKRFGFAFVRFDDWPVGGLPNNQESCIIKYQTSDGTDFPSTPTVYPITGGSLSTGDVAFSSYTSSFYFVKYLETGTTRTGYQINQFNINTGSTTVNATFAITEPIEHIENYKYRLVGHSPSGRKLYYSGTDKTTWNPATQYYEFDSGIYRVEARTDDLLVFTFDGVYSVTGVLGASVNIQQIIPANNMYEGMWGGTTINRSFYFMDELFTGPTDGRAYRLIGATIQQVAAFQEEDYGNQPNGDFTCEDGRPGAIAGGKLAFAFKRGMVYAENGPNVYTRIKAVSNPSYSPADVRQYQIALPAYLAPTEYFLYGMIEYPFDPLDPPSFRSYRGIHNVTEPTKIDAVFTSGADGYTPTGTPFRQAGGTVQLPEYWHQKPFTVKEVFVEYKATEDYAGYADPAVSIKIVPTGVVDVPSANVIISESNTVNNITLVKGEYVMYRSQPNNASKGFGMKPILSIVDTAVKRVIINCED
jgi:hypothetical protein